MTCEFLQFFLSCRAFRGNLILSTRLPHMKFHQIYSNPNEGLKRFNLSHEREREQQDLIEINRYEYIKIRLYYFILFQFEIYRHGETIHQPVVRHLTKASFSLEYEGQYFAFYRGQSFHRSLPGRESLRILYRYVTDNMMG